MATDPTTVDEEVEERGRWSTSPLRLALIVALTLLVGGGLLAAAWWWLSDGDALADEEPEEPEEGEIVELEAMTVGLADGGHARVGIALVLAEGYDHDDISQQLPLLNDAALSRVAEFESEDLTSPEGMDQLRQRLAEDAADIYNGQEGEKDEEPVVLRVVFTELVVQ